MAEVDKKTLSNWSPSISPSPKSPTNSSCVLSKPSLIAVFWQSLAACAHLLTLTSNLSPPRLLATTAGISMSGIGDEWEGERLHFSQKGRSRSWLVALSVCAQLADSLHCAWKQPGGLCERPTRNVKETIQEKQPLSQKRHWRTQKTVSLWKNVFLPESLLTLTRWVRTFTGQRAHLKTAQLSSFGGRYHLGTALILSLIHFTLRLFHLSGGLWTIV